MGMVTWSRTSRLFLATCFGFLLLSSSLMRYAPAPAWALDLSHPKYHLQTRRNTAGQEDRKEGIEPVKIAGEHLELIGAFLNVPALPSGGAGTTYHLGFYLKEAESRVDIVVFAFVLHRIPHATEMTLHLVTKNWAFVLRDRESTQPLIQGVSLTSLTLSGMLALTLEVEELQYQGQPLQLPGNRLILRAQQPQVSYTLRALPDSELRLVQLDLSGNSKVLLSTAGAGQLQMDVQSPQRSQLELAVDGRRFTLSIADGITLLNEQGHEIPLRPGPSPPTPEVTAASSRLVLEPQAETPFGLDMQISSQEQVGDIWELSPAFGRVRMTRVAFHHRELR